MIERNLRYVTLRKHGSAFLDAFGFLPLDYFGAVGDNSTDNYANIQVAINESLKRGYNYIFVPKGTYYYQGTLVDLDKITFIGNSDNAKIYDGENEIPIYQLGTQAPYKKGSTSISMIVEEDGYIDISVPVKNPVEAIVVINGNVLYVTDDLYTIDGQILDNYHLTSNIMMMNIKLIKNNIRITYGLDPDPLTPSELDIRVDWRVR